MKMYVNCELKAHTKGSEHCIGCHSKGCHVTDTNTLLMIGRPNYSPHFHCTKFDSGDISFWERCLSNKDVETLCGAPIGNTFIYKRFRCSVQTQFFQTCRFAGHDSPVMIRPWSNNGEGNSSMKWIRRVTTYFLKYKHPFFKRDSPATIRL